MNAIANFVVKRRKFIVALVLAITVLCTILFLKVDINYNMTDYLPEDANSTIALDTLDEEFGEAVPNCNVMIKGISIEEALSIKGQLEGMEGVDNVSWLDDTVDIKRPLEVQDQDMVEDYYSNGNALFSVTIADGEERAATDLIENELGKEHKVYMSGNAVEQADSQRLATSQTVKAICVLAPLIILILIIATTSWAEPFIYLLAIGAAVMVNLGTEIFRGEISYVTLAVAPILQMAVSLDYAVFLSSSFQAHRITAKDDKTAMKFAMNDSVKSIAASALTTIFGFLALTLMKFEIGPDMGISLVKGVILSFISCMTFLPAAILLLNKLIDKTKHRKFMPDFKGAGKVAVKIRIPVFIIVAFIAVFCFLAQGNNNFTYGSGDAAGNTPSAVAIKEEFGESNTMVLMVPKGDRAKEKVLSEQIEDMDYVTSVLSYANQVGAEIPPEYLSKEVQENFYGENYTRIIIYSNLPDESEESFALVENVRNSAEKLYGDNVLSCGQSANLYDMKNTVETDNSLVSVVTVLAIYVVLAIMLKSWFLPILLILTIKIAIWINMAIPFFTGSSLIYLGYLVVSTVQMGATIDYAILLTDHYMDNRKKAPAIKAMERTMHQTIPSVLVSAFVLAIAGFALALVSSNDMVRALGILIGRGAVIPLILVNIFLPALLILFDKVIPYTTLKANFFRAVKKDNRMEVIDTRAEIEEYNEYEEERTVAGFLGASSEETYDDLDDSVAWNGGDR
ncbi:MAG: MMPL family transporter [Lachnospiraceae bacterium]|nr:MMPL family transporter [Lachnospiraceae bacterium]